MDTENKRYEKRATSNERGFTLAEAILATVVLGIAAAGVLLPFASGARVHVEGTRRTLAAKLASDLMEQIVNTPFDQIVATYNYSESEGQIKDASGIVFTDPTYAKFSRDVNCQYVRVQQQIETGQPNFIRVSVRVCYSGRELAGMNRLISK